MENKAISGGGIKQSDPFSKLVEVFWTFGSTAATILPQDYPIALPVPEPGQVWDNLDHANLLLAGVVQNGCSNSTVIDVSMTSSVGVVQGATFGEVELKDETVGHGFYTFRYKIRATGAEGEVSDFIFSGEAPVTCVGQATPL